MFVFFQHQCEEVFGLIMQSVRQSKDVLQSHRICSLKIEQELMM